MSTESKARLKITYATLRADNEELHALYDQGVERARARLGAYHPNVIDGRERDGQGTFEVRSPIDRDLLVGTFAKGTREDVRDAVKAARAAQPAWAAMPWRDRLAIIRRAAELISERQMEYGALMAFEVGRTPPGGAGRGRGGGRPLPLLLRRVRAEQRLRPPDGEPG